MIHSWSLPVLNLVVHGRGHAMKLGHLTPVLSLGQLSKRHRAPGGLQATHKFQLLKESWAV